MEMKTAVKKIRENKETSTKVLLKTPGTVLYLILSVRCVTKLLYCVSLSFSRSMKPESHRSSDGCTVFKRIRMGKDYKLP